MGTAILLAHGLLWSSYYQSLQVWLWQSLWIWNAPVRYHAENIMMLSFDKDGNLEWSNVIPKSQFDDETDNAISYQIMNTGGELHFLYNQYERRNILLTDQSISPEGKITASSNA